MNKSSLLILTILSCATFSACSGGSRSENVVIPVSAAAINATDTPAEQKAEELAKGAEILLSADGFLQANDLAALALKSDATNFRALLIRKILAPIVLQKGIVRRLQPLAEKNPRLLSSLDESTASLQSRTATSAGSAFMLDGTPDIRSEDDLQAHLDRTIEAIEDLREFMRANKDREITLQVASAFAKDLTERFVAACELKTNDKYEYELICPPSAQRRSVTLNRADFEILHDTVTYYMIQLLIANAFDLDGLAAELKSGRPLSELYDRLMSNSRFGRTREAKYLKRVRSLGVDLVTALNWAMVNQDTLCPRGTQVAGTQRPGMFFDKGLCTYGTYFKPAIDAIGLNLSGHARDADIVVAGQLKTTKIFWLAPFERPIADLRELGTIKFKASGDIESTSDQTMGGIFPNGDANIFLNNRDSAVVYR